MSKVIKEYEGYNCVVVVKPHNDGFILVSEAANAEITWFAPLYFIRGITEDDYVWNLEATNELVIFETEEKAIAMFFALYL